MIKVLTIAGSDSGGGAGIQADLKTITVLGGYGLSVITALTAQNTLGVTGIEPVPPRFVAEQLDAVLSDIGADGAKTGMLFSQEIIRTVAAKLKKYGVKNLVVDPVMVAASGDPLLKPEAERAMVAHLFPLAGLVTPNIPEAERILGGKISTIEDMRDAAKGLAKMGPGAIVVKGGHLEGSASDVLFDGENFHILEAPRIPTENTHGTGCVFSAAAATFLAQGLPMLRAVSGAKEFITRAIRHSLDVGQGRGPADPYMAAMADTKRLAVLEALGEGFRALELDPLSRFMVPEVQSNLVYALPGASSTAEVAGFPGRIVRLGRGVARLAGPRFGASEHMARVVITAMSRLPALRAAMNVRYSPEAIEAAEELGMRAASFSREDEPRDIKAREGSTLSWGVARALDSSPARPDLVFDTGEKGKEAMIRVLGESPGEVVEKVLSLAHRLFPKRPG